MYSKYSVILATLCFAVIAGKVKGFAPPQAFINLTTKTNVDVQPAPLKSTTMNEEDTSNRDEERSPVNPSSEFGRPIAPQLSTINRTAISFIKSLFDKLFDTSNSTDREYVLTRSYARFYALETIARMPYFSYLSVLHLYETLGWWRRSDYLKVHFCESWNELHHLLIMEELGGSSRYFDRFVAQHSAFFYYWFVVFFYLINPVFAYNLNEVSSIH
jgi:hypothetical protein